MASAADEFALREDLVHLNHAAVAPWPRRTAEAVKRFADDNLHEGPWAYDRWVATEQRLRERLRALLGAGAAEDIALVKSTSEGLSLVAHGLPWSAGDNVVISDQEFPSNRIVWESLAAQGVVVREVGLGTDDPEAALCAATDERTRLMSISSVQYATGLRLDLGRLGRHCRERGILFCIDAIQSLGALPFDVNAAHADFVMADGHKWMLGPEGLGVFWCRPALRERLELRQFGWHMVEHRGAFERRDWRAAPDARRFEPGSPNLLGAHALEASLSLLEEVGMHVVATAVLERTSYLIERLKLLPDVELVTPEPTTRRAGIVTFRATRTDPKRLHARLRERRILCAVRHGGVRLSPHFYTPRTHLDRALAVIAEGCA